MKPKAFVALLVFVSLAGAAWGVYQWSPWRARTVIVQLENQKLNFTGRATVKKNRVVVHVPRRTTWRNVEQGDTVRTVETHVAAHTVIFPLTNVQFVVIE